MTPPLTSPYTEHPGQPTSVIFPNHGYQIFSIIISLTGTSVLSFVLARRTSAENLFSIEGWKRLSWPKLCVILVFVDSWIFVFTAAVLISGTGLSLDHTTCSLGILSCIVLYAISKVLIYAFLIEKVWLVWTPRLPRNAGHKQPSRWSSPMYRLCMGCLSPFFIIGFLLIFGRIALIRTDGACIIGLKQYASLALLSYDLFITGCLTVLFVYPLTRGDIISPRLRRIASRTLVASIMALITSAINISILTIMKGQLGWVCLDSCGTDVTINAIVIFWVTRGTAASRSTTHVAGDPNSPTDSKFQRPIGSLSAIQTYDGPPLRGWRTRSSYEKEDNEFIEDDDDADEEGTHWRDPAALQCARGGPSSHPSSGYEELQSPPPALPRCGCCPYSPTIPRPSHPVVQPPRLGPAANAARSKKRNDVHRPVSAADPKQPPQRPANLIRRSTAGDAVPALGVFRGLGSLISRRANTTRETRTQQATEISTIEFRPCRSDTISSSSGESDPPSPLRLRRQLSFLSSQAGATVDQPQVLKSFLEDEDYEHEHEHDHETP